MAKLDILPSVALSLLVAVFPVNGLICYSCSSSFGDRDWSCELNPTEKAECSKKYCVTKFADYDNPKVGDAYLSRYCADNVPHQKDSSTHYEVCTTNLCNNIQGKSQVVNGSHHGMLDTYCGRGRRCNEQRRCEVDGKIGLCMGANSCWNQNGIYIGDCPNWYGVCCKFQYMCGAVTSKRQAYFVNPNTYTPYCAMTIQIQDRSVTQVRLDFKRFSLAQPNGGTNIAPTAYNCEQDKFMVMSSTYGGNLGFTSLCGENTGQHIYIPVDASMGTATVQLIFQLSGGFPSNWQIGISQLDCSSSQTSQLCAPQGCLQYYSSRSGTFESFNYNNGAGSYFGLLNYAICFKRNGGVCGIQYRPQSFILATDDMSSPYGDSGCNVQSTGGEPASRDYITIPEGRTENNVVSSKFCGEGLSPSNAVTSNAPGPFSMIFRTDAERNPIITGDEKGFRFTYQETGTGC